VLLDLGLPDSIGIDALRSFRKAFPHSKIVIVSSNDGDDVVEDALDAGANGFVPKSLDMSAMLAALRVVANGDVYQPPGFARASRPST
jgi:DNA-binding NarL/FixJ family response regulator